MVDDLKKRLDILRAVAPRLNQVTDEATKIVSRVEKVLTEELHLGIACDVCFYRQEGKDPVTDEFGNNEEGEHIDWIDYRSIAFGRVAGSYRVHVLDERYHKDDYGVYTVRVDENRTPWPSCDRETKLQAFAKLPQLLDEIFKKADDLAKTAEKTAEAVKQMLSQVE